MLAPSTAPRPRRTPNLHRLGFRARDLRLARWLAPSLGESVHLQPRSGSPAASAAGDLRATLTGLAAPMRGAWFAAAARRALLCGLAAGIALTLLAGEVGWPRWLGAACCLAITAVAAAAAARQAPGVPETARFLDRTLGLGEQLGTAIELDGVAHPSILAAELRQRAGASARRAAADWKPRAAGAPRELAALALLICALGVACALPLGTGSTRPSAAARQNGGLQATPPIPTAPSGPVHGIAVQVAVVSSQETAAAAPAQPSRASSPTAPQGAAPRGTALARARSTPGTTGRGTTTHGAGGSGQKAGTSATATGGHTLPLLKHSENFLATSPAAKGQKGSFYSGAQAQGAKAGRSGAQSGTGGPASRAQSGSAGTGKETTKQGGPSSGNQAGNTPGKGAAGKAQAGKPAQCQLLYTCSRINASQLTAPGLITGKGQFTGKGLPGGQTAGHAQGASPGAGSAKMQIPASGHQLTITSGYAAANGTQRAAKQAQGHNGPGSAQQAVVSAATPGVQTFDYVAPDANILLPAQSALIGRYFAAHAAS